MNDVLDIGCIEALNFLNYKVKQYNQQKRKADLERSFNR